VERLKKNYLNNQKPPQNFFKPPNLYPNMTDLKEELGNVLEKYFPLQLLDPDNELLKYFILDSNGFRRNQDKEIKIEFLERFRGDFPTKSDLEESGIEISFLEYGNGLISSLFQNYCGALEKEMEYVNIRN